ncbi:MAG: hypothetical protein RML14_01570, partial [Meiothermus sp.]|uniref:hypothetical protein n=1 Tax=Meiothermus sp. TaxID=1955249 RepID=UPI00298EFB4B
GLLNWDARRRQTDVAFEALRVEKERIEADIRLGIATLEARQRLAQIEAQMQAILAQQRSDTDRARAYYSFAKTRAFSGALVALAGVALIAGAFYLAERGAA